MLILASQSPRRKELLELAGLDYVCEPADIDETIPEGMAAEDVPETMRRLIEKEIQKAREQIQNQA